LIRFLFDKIFIDSKQTLNQLLIDADNILKNDHVNKIHQSVSNIQKEDVSIFNKQEKFEIFQPKLTFNNEEVYIESTSL